MLEETNGKIHRMSLEAIAGAQSLASESELTVAALAIGRNADKLAEQASQFDLNEILKVDNDQLSNYSSDGYSETLNQVILAESPKYIFFGHTYQVRDYVPKLSAKLMKPFFADNVAVNLNDGSVSCSKQTFNAKLFSDVESSGDGPYLISLQSAAYSSDSLKTGECSIREVTVNIDSSLIKTTSEEPFKETSDDLDLTAADLIVSVGRGIGKEENIPLARELAEAIGAELSSDSSKTESIINVIEKNNINDIESLIDSITESIDLGTEFIMPGTSSSSAAIDISRTVARRLERIVVSINKSEPVNKNILIYLNRISDLLFVLGRLEDKGKDIKKIRGIRKKK